MEFMAIKDFQGKAVYVEGDLISVNDEIAIVPASGKFFYCCGGHARMLSSNVLVIELQNNTTVRETGQTKQGTSTTIQSMHWDVQHKGDHLDGNGTLKYRMIVTADTLGSASGSFFGFVEDDADDPRV